MTYSYDEKYVYDAMENLGDAFDYAVNDCNMEISRFMDLFIASGIAKQFGNGNPKYVCGLSGIELVMEVARACGSTQNMPESDDWFDRTPEYWCGWIIAYYQWRTGQSFKNIMQAITMDDVLNLYNPLHEASEEKFVDTLNAIIVRRKTQTNLQKIRKNAGYSQSELAKKSNVTLRMIQQYEQKVKDINKASVQTLSSLARTLGCGIEDLLEMEIIAGN